MKRTCSMDFNRLIWGNLKSLPDEFDRLPEMLLVPAQSTTAGRLTGRCRTGTIGKSPVSVRLLKENNEWVIDEISVRQPDGVVFNIRQNLRREIAQRFLDNPDGGIMQAVNETQPGQSFRRCSCLGESQAPRRGNLTLPSSGKPRARTAVTSAGIDMTPAPKPQPAPIDGILKFGPDASAAASQDTPPAMVRWKKSKK